MSPPLPALDEPPTDIRFLRGFWKLVRWALPVQFRYFGLYEYRIAKVYISTPPASVSGPTMDLQATEDTVALGLADIAKVPAWAGLPGAQPNPTPGSRVLVQFINGSGGRPVVVQWAAPGDSGWQPAGLTVDATGPIVIGGNAPSVGVGGLGGLALATAIPVEAWAGEVVTALGALGQTVGGLSCATTKAKGV